MKILIFTEVIAGKGHEKAAQSIAKAINRLDCSHDVKIVNLLSIINKSLEKILELTYMTMIKNFPRLWGLIHEKESRFSFLFKDIIANVLLKKLKKYIEQEKPELIITTHASGLGALSKLKEKYIFCLAAVFTDYQINSFWVQEHIDYYFVAHDEFKQKLIEKYNVDPRKIIISGIPIDPIFSHKAVKRDEETKNRKSFQLLIMGGGLGFGGIKEIIYSLDQLKNIPISINVLAGTNKKLYSELSQIKSKLGFTIQIFKYVDNIYPLMKNSDLIISKPGGLTVSEALTIPVPILIYKPIPGQEEQNAKFLMKKKSAIRVNQIKYIPYWIQYLYTNPKLHIKLMENEQKIAKPNSSIYISETLLNNVYESQTLVHR